MAAVPPVAFGPRYTTSKDPTYKSANLIVNKLNDFNGLELEVIAARKDLN